MPGSPPQDRMTAEPGGLREGFTTGTAATAAACAALELLLTGAGPDNPEPCDGTAVAPAPQTVPLPPFLASGAGSNDSAEPAAFLAVPVAHARRLAPRRAEAAVIKDGGDDPDVTHGATIHALVELLAPEAPRTSAGAVMADSGQAPHAAHEGIFLPGPPPVELLAGPGVGRVTLPGLPVAVGEPAINPVPRQQIHAGIRRVAARYHYAGGLRVTLSIPDGEERARRTFNPRLGIVGGLSILGTHGIVRPYSHEAWTASIREGLSVAAATGCEMAVLSTGRRSERLLQGLYADVPGTAFVQAADFAAFSLSTAAGFGFHRLVWGCFFGKLVKLAQGLPHTHAHEAALDMERLAAWCREDGMEPTQAAQVAACTTAGHALDIITAHASGPAILRQMARRGKAAAESFAADSGRNPQITLHLFHLNGKELARA